MPDTEAPVPVVGPQGSFGLGSFSTPLRWLALVGAGVVLGGGFIEPPVSSERTHVPGRPERAPAPRIKLPAGVYRIEVEPHQRAANLPERRTYVYVNGMMNPETQIRGDGHDLAVALGSSVVVVPNSSRLNAVEDVGSALAGIFSSRAGAERRREAVENVIAVTKAAMDCGHEVVLVGHSQGAIIVGNALSELESRSTPEEWSHVCAVVKVVCFGTALHDFPWGIDAVAYSHEGDIVSNGTRIAAGARRRMGISDDVPVPEYIAPGSSHVLYDYMRSLPRFLELRTGEGWRAEGTLLGKAFVRSVFKGEFSDGTYGDLARQRIEAGDADFARTVVGALQDGKIGRFAFTDAVLADLKQLGGS